MYLAVDIGGTKTLLAVFSPGGDLKEKLRFATPQDYDEFLETFKENLAKLETQDFLACGLGVPGKLDRAHGLGVAFGNLSWQSVPIQSDVEIITNAPVLFENDSKLAGLSEAILIINEFKKVLYVTIGTGISSALVTNGVLDKDFIDSEAGHMLLEHKDQLVYWEDFAAGPAITKQFGRPVSEINDEASLYKIARNIAVGLIDLIAVVVPEVIVIGGGVGVYLDKFKGRLEEELKIYEHPLLTLPVILKAKRPEEAVIYGCYELAKSHHESLDKVA